MIQHGVAPFLECSSAGEVRLSAFYARIQGRGGKTIEELYQAAKIFSNGKTGLTWKEAKGRRPINAGVVRQLYSQLWDEYIRENPSLLRLIRGATGLSDKFGKPGHACQATELWRIKNDLRFTIPKRRNIEEG